MKSSQKISPSRAARTLVFSALIWLALVAVPVSAEDGSSNSGQNPAGVDENGNATFIQGTMAPTEPATQVQSDLAVKENLLKLHGFKDWDDWKKRVQEKTGLQFSVDYTAQGYWANENKLGEDDAGSGALRFYGRWDVMGKGTDTAGGIVFKIENRHSYTDVAVSDFGGELGYVGAVSPLLSAQGTRITHLHWRKAFNKGKSVYYAGWLDFTDYTDAYALASPWEDFSNLVFITGSGTIDGYPDGSLGVMGATFLSEHVYGSASIVDANSDPTDLFSGFETFFGDFETLKTLEIGYTQMPELVFLNNVHVTVWQIDERTQAEQPNGWGATFSISGLVGSRWFPFLRAGWSKDGGTLYEGSVSTGFGFKPARGVGFWGIGLNWARPNENTFGAELNDQYTLETYFRLQLTQRFQLTPSIQYLKNPAANPLQSSLFVFGLRARAAF